MPSGPISRGAFGTPINESFLEQGTIDMLQNAGIPTASSSSGSNVAKLIVSLDRDQIPTNRGESIFSCDVMGRINLNTRGAQIAPILVQYGGYGVSGGPYLAEDSVEISSSAITDFISAWNSVH
ncbi:hypothetical protein [Vasconcelosia minhoensis]|uniref:hypothetical protein n=1 Tax=Vasconcelosia minhoensis TaxID=3366354 RepID=UPI001D1540BD|nr:hypothetical protein [Romeria gracilis]